MVLCFKTDKQTLDQRVELHQRARDTTEQNIKEETEALQKAMAVSSKPSYISYSDFYTNILEIIAIEK